MMDWSHGGMGYGGMVLMAVVILAFWGLVIYAVVAITRGAHRPEPRPDPLRVLDERFARGEIDETEYRQRHTVLKPPSR